MKGLGDLGRIAVEERCPVRRVPLYASTKHTFATSVIAAGGAEADLKEYLGHKDIRSTHSYVRAAKQRCSSIQSLGLVGKQPEDASNVEKDGTDDD